MTAKITSRASFTILNKQMTQINTAERLAAKAFFVLFCKVTTNCNSTKPYNKSLINLVCSFCTGKYCLQFLSHRPRSFVARSVRKTSGNTFPYRPRTRLISPYSCTMPSVIKDTLQFKAALVVYTESYSSRFNFQSASLKSDMHEHIRLF